MVFLLEEAPKFGVHFFFGGPLSFMLNSGKVVPKSLRDRVQFFVFGMRVMDQGLLPKTYNAKEPYPEVDVAYFHDRKSEQLMKLSAIEESEG